MNHCLHSWAEIIFGLNALNGKRIRSDGSIAGAWDSSNGEAFIHYIVEKGYNIYGWELGNIIYLSMVSLLQKCFFSVFI